jgi:hypothetical protein
MAWTLLEIGLRQSVQVQKLVSDGGGQHSLRYAPAPAPEGQASERRKWGERWYSRNTGSARFDATHTPMTSMITRYITISSLSDLTILPRGEVPLVALHAHAPPRIKSYAGLELRLSLLWNGTENSIVRKPWGNPRSVPLTIWKNIND